VPEPHGAVVAGGDDAVARGLKATLRTQSSWPSKGSAAGVPSRCQSRTVPSALAETMRSPAGLKATLVTAPS
jgi:hypothetical protein